MADVKRQDFKHIFVHASFPKLNLEQTLEHFIEHVNMFKTSHATAEISGYHNESVLFQIQCRTILFQISWWTMQER